MKKRITAVWLLAAALLCGGCGAGFDAAAYVRGILNNLYLGDCSEYLQTADISEEEAAQEREQGIEAETDYFLEYYGIGEISDGVRGQIGDMYRTIYSRSKYEVLEAVLSLPVRYKDAVYLHYYEGYTAPEIAKILGKNVNTIYTLLNRARQLLREKLGGDDL